MEFAYIAVIGFSLGYVMRRFLRWVEKIELERERQQNFDKFIDKGLEDFRQRFKQAIKNGRTGL